MCTPVGSRSPGTTPARRPPAQVQPTLDRTRTHVVGHGHRRNLSPTVDRATPTGRRSGPVPVPNLRHRCGGGLAFGDHATTLHRTDTRARTERAAMCAVRARTLWRAVRRS